MEKILRIKDIITENNTHFAKNKPLNIVPTEF